MLPWTIKVEHQITQPESQLAVMETCYEEPALEETYMTEEVKMRSQAQKQGQQHQGSQSQFQKYQYVGQKKFQGNQNYNKSGYGSGYKSQYNKGNNQCYGNKSPYQGQKQPAASPSTCTTAKNQLWHDTTYEVWVGTIP